MNHIRNILTIAGIWGLACFFYYSGYYGALNGVHELSFPTGIMIGVLPLVVFRIVLKRFFR